ncbi:hypothetical protein T9R20_01910 [Microbacterium invictum]|uniref:Uncharacterized protein n=1 Tax=Microbacterium invictum TaxID=515415 RepID=A0ABZ0VAS5_9MICO|nr:hypothetical protein [Microbacterium invictum]WQB70736.1 hypothetical protein T9R20_01910 [Microbacterium invictum]
MPRAPPSREVVRIGGPDGGDVDLQASRRDRQAGIHDHLAYDGGPEQHREHDVGISDGIRSGVVARAAPEATSSAA